MLASIYSIALLLLLSLLRPFPSLAVPSQVMNARGVRGGCPGAPISADPASATVEH